MFGFLKKLFGGGGLSEDMINKINNRGSVLDVRTIAEFKGGHIKGSVNIPLSSVNNKAKSIKKMKQPVIIVCRSGVRAGSALSQISSMGVEAYNGGGWTSVNQIITTK